MKPQKRRLGRPDQQGSEDLVRHIVDTATRLFIDKGYAAVSIEQIAVAAQSGKPTIYRHFGSKEGLFMAVIDRQTQRLLELARTVESGSSDPMDALKSTCRFLLDFVLHPDLVSLYRTLVAEVGRFPDLGEHVLENCAAPIKAVNLRLLRAAMDAGVLREMDTELAELILGSVITGGPIQQALLGSRRFERPEDRDAYFETAWTIFVRGAA